MKNMPAYIIELDQALDEGMAKAIPVIVKQVDKERKDIMINSLKKLLKSRQSEGYNTDHLDGIRSAIDALTQID